MENYKLNIIITFSNLFDTFLPYFNKFTGVGHLFASYMYGYVIDVSLERRCP